VRIGRILEYRGYKGYWSIEDRRDTGV